MTTNKKNRNTKALPVVNSDRFNVFDIGFHGDLYLIKFIDSIAENCQFFVETGSNVGSSLAYFARKHPEIICVSCEPDINAFRLAKKHTAELNNVSIFNELSQDFLVRLGSDYSNFFNKECLFWLDAHGYGFRWPLGEEIKFITENFAKAYIFIDDFKVPGLEDFFGYDIYKNQVCSLEYIREYFFENKNYRVYYPSYTEKTSQHHPLRGWGLIEFGHTSDLVIPRQLQDKVKQVPF